MIGPLAWDRGGPDRRIDSRQVTFDASGVNTVISRMTSAQAPHRRGSASIRPRRQSRRKNR